MTRKGDVYIYNNIRFTRGKIQPSANGSTRRYLLTACLRLTKTGQTIIRGWGGAR